MVQIELCPRALLAAILAGVAITGIDVDARKTNSRLGEVLKRRQDQDAGNSNGSINGRDGLMIVYGNTRPVVDDVLAILIVNRLGHPLVKQSEGSTNRCHMNGLVITIQHKHGAIEHHGALPVWVRF